MSSSFGPSLTLPERSYDLVVVGSSAGGIEALSTLVRGLPANFAASLVLAQHLDPERTSHLANILARHTTLEIRTVEATETLRPGVIYVVPPDRDVEITDHEVYLQSATHNSRPSVNRLFHSAATSFGERLIGVILTGTGSDGASGALDVKAAGGLIVIEDPATAAFASMPLSLIPSSVDIVAELPQIGPLLGELVVGKYILEPAEVDQALPQLLNQVHDQSGIDFTAYKPQTILRRLQRRLAITRTNSLGDYLHYLNTNPEEYQLLVASFLINVTEFFRDPPLFTLLREEILPALIAQARAQGRALRCWSAGCATGEEAYSLALLVAELLGDNPDQLGVRIFATDVDEEALTFARRGVFPAAALSAVPSELVDLGFTNLDGAYEIRPQVRNMVLFGLHDLAQRAPFPNLDLVICRNVLIYFAPELQKRVIQVFAFALRDGGYLALGKAETPAAFAASFIPVHPPLKLYQRHGQRVSLPPPNVTRPPQMAFPTPGSTRTLYKSSSYPGPLTRTAQVTEHLISFLMEAPIGVVLLDRHYDIQAINRTAQQLLGIFRPALGEDLIHLVTTLSSTALRSAIDMAFNQHGPQTEVYLDTISGEPRVLQIGAVGSAAEVEDDHALLLFTDVTARVMAQRQEEALRQQRQQEAAAEAAAARSRRTPKEREWEAERQQLQGEIDRLGAQVQQAALSNRALFIANDELLRSNQNITSLNEDLSVRNEELEASLEEIRTLNEELQATNEELETLNEELEATTEELRATNDDLVARTNEIQQLATIHEAQRQLSDSRAVELSAILESMSDAVLVIDQAGETKLTNAAFLTLFGNNRADFAAEDEGGKPLSAEQMPRQRILAGASFQMVFTQPLATGRRWLEATGRPIAIRGIPAGGVITIRDITDRSLRRMQDEFLALAHHELLTPMTTLQASAQLLERRLQLTDDKGTLLLQTLIRKIQQMRGLINDLADVDRLQHGKLRLNLTLIDLHELAEHTIASLSLTNPKPPIILEATGQLLIQGDALRLEQILTNLLTNAFKYASDSPQIVVRLRAVGDIAEVQVQDGGPGIAADVLPHLFMRFFQGQPQEQRSRSGLGLGLFITREMVEAHQGDIQVASQVGQGTTFTLHFPLLNAGLSM